MKDSYKWIIRCILSSTNAFQFLACKTLIDLFDKMYKDKASCAELENSLENQKGHYKNQVSEI